MRWAAYRAAPTWVEQAQDEIQGEGAFFEAGMQGSPAHQAHDQESGPGFTPVIVEGHDVGVLQAGDELRFSLKAADELRVVGVAGHDDLDRHFALDQGLDGAVYHAETAFTHAVTELVAADGAPGQVFETDLVG
jgi:hypothetical protein